MRYIFILNPRAGNGTVWRKKQTIERLVAEHQLQAELYWTQKPGDGQRLAREWGNQADVVVAVGGDGTINEVASGLIESGASATLGVLPMGTGNDFAKMLGLRPHLESSFHELLRNQEKMVDYGRVRLLEKGVWTTKYFVNISGMGFDAATSHQASRLKFIPGKTLPYLTAVLKTLARWNFPKAALYVDGETAPRYNGGMLFVTVGNGACSGGGFWLTPEAAIDDGVLDSIWVTETTKTRILKILPKALKGTHVYEREIELQKIHTLRMVPETPLPYHADGEVVSLSVEEALIEIVPFGLSVLMTK